MGSARMLTATVAWSVRAAATDGDPVRLCRTVLGSVSGGFGFMVCQSLKLKHFQLEAKKPN